MLNDVFCFFFYNTLLLLFASGFAFCSSSIVFPSAAARCESNDQQPEAFCRETNCSKESSEGLSDKHSFGKKINPGQKHKEKKSLHYITFVLLPRFILYSRFLLPTIDIKIRFSGTWSTVKREIRTRKKRIKLHSTRKK